MPTINQAMVTALTNAHTTLKINGVTAVVGTAINLNDNLVITADNGYAFTKVTPYERKTYTYPVKTKAYFVGFDGYEGEDMCYNFLISTDLKTGTLQYLQDDGFESLNIETVSVVVPPVYTFTQSDIDEMVDSDVTMTVNGLDVVVGSEVLTGDVLLATANNGTSFFIKEFPPIASIYFSGFDSGAGEDITKPFTLSEDKLTATLIMPEPYDSVWTFVLYSATETSTPDVLGTNNVYVIDEDILKQVNNQRFESNGESGSVYDYGQFILSVLELPFSVDPSLITPAENVKLATKVLTVQAPKITVDIITINIGEIFTPKTFNNLKDYVNTNAVLHLPRIPSVVLDLEYVIGETISIFYDINCYTGKATVRILSSKIDDVILMINADLGIEVPFISNQFNPPENTNFTLGGDNGVINAFIEIIRSESLLSDGFYTVPIIDESVLLGQIGFIVVDDINLNTTALRGEKTEIISYLNNGVIIK